MPFHFCIKSALCLSWLVMSEELRALRECVYNMSTALEAVRGLSARLDVLETPKLHDLAVDDSAPLSLADYVTDFIMLWLLAAVYESCRTHSDGGNT